MLLHNPAARFASSHSPFREQRELFLQPTGNTGRFHRQQLDATDGATASEHVAHGPERDVHDIISQTRARLRDLLPQIDQLQEVREPLIAKEHIDAGLIIENTKSDVFNLLEGNSKESAEEAEYKTQKLEAFLNHVTRSRENVREFNAEERDSRKLKNVNAFYDRADESIAVNPKITGEKRDAKILHERRHAFLHALEGLDAAALSRTYETAKGTVDAVSGKTFGQLLEELIHGQNGKKNGHYAYRYYGNNALAAFEELLIRAADSQAGTETLDQDEQRLLQLLNESRTSKTQVPGKERQTPDESKRFAADTEPSEGAPDTEKKNEEKEKSVPLTARQLLKSVADKEKQLQKTIDQLKDVDGLIDSIPELKDRAKIKEKWTAHRKILEDCLITTSGYTTFLHAADAWKGGTMDPKQLEELLNRMFLNQEPGSPGSVSVGDNAFKNEWLTVGNVSKRMELAQQFPLDEELMAIQKHMELIDLELPKVGDNFTELQTLVKSSANPARKGVLELAGLEFYSINQVIESVKNVFESFSKAWSNWSQLKVSKLSYQIGKATHILPFGDQAAVALEMELDHKNDDIKDGYKKHLEHDLASFDHCFNADHTDHSLFHMNINDPNRFRGTIEYMAGNGWLYDIDPIAGTVFDVHIDKFLPPTWPKLRKEMYLRDLEQQNSDGEEKASKKGTSRVDTYPDIPPMMTVLQDELDRHNFWAVQGILQRAIQKGKMGETSTWASTIILKSIEKDPVTRKYFPKGLMDQLGNIGISSPAWASTFFKLNRGKLMDFKKKKIPFEDAGTLAGVIKEAEKQILRIRKASGLQDLNTEKNPEDAALLNQLIGKVLACQVVNSDGRGGEPWSESISIFDENDMFKKYRDDIQNFKGTIEPGKCDDDFYNGVDNGSSESILKSGANFDTIFQPASQGTFVQAQKANFFLEQIIYGHDQLKLRHEATKKKGNPAAIARTRAALDSYRKMMYDKMAYVAKNSWQQGTAGLLVQITGRCTDTTPGKRSEVSKDFMIYELSRRGMFPTPEELKQMLYGTESPFNKAWKAQYDKFGPKPLPID